MDNKELAAMLEPVDPQLFLYCSGLYSAAAHLQMPVENPENRPIHFDDGTAIALTDIPVNRGMLAVTKELREQKVSEETKAAMVTRLLHFGEILDAKGALAEWIKPSDAEGALSVSEAVILACASARLIVENDHIRYDVEDVARIAKQYDDEEAAREKQHG